MNSSNQKTGFSIAVMIGVVIVAGIAVDWWDARQSHMVPKPPAELVTDGLAINRLMDENERLKMDYGLLSIENDSLRKQIEELNQKFAELPKPEVVKGDKSTGE